ncbi:hypothetical protein [Haloferax denitrificans]|uniref:hypothetical protein n=1 Tax=Haloferax denitrificans TaxID=35745 RepID=UPI003C6F72AE
MAVGKYLKSEINNFYVRSLIPIYFCVLIVTSAVFSLPRQIFPEISFLACGLVLLVLPGFGILSLVQPAYGFYTRVFFAIPISFLTSAVVVYFIAISPLPLDDYSILLINGTISVGTLSLTKHLGNDLVSLPEFRIHRVKQKVIIWCLVILLAVIHYGPVFGVGGQIHGRMWGYNYNYIAKSLAENGVYPQIEPSSMIFEGMQYSIESDFLQHASIAAARLVFDGYEAFPYPTVVLIGVLLGISTRYFSSTLPGAISILSILSFPIIHSSNMHFNAVTLTTALFLFTSALTTDLIYRNDSKNIFIIASISVVVTRYYHSAAYYFAVFLVVVCFLSLLYNWWSTRSLSPRTTMYTMVASILGIYLLFTSDRLSRIILTGVSALPTAFSSGAGANPLLPYLYPTPIELYLYTGIFVGIIAILASIGLWKDRRRLYNQPEFLVYLLIGLIFSGSIAPLLLVHGLVNRAVITFGVPLMITALMLLVNSNPDKNKLLPVVLGIIIFISGVSGVGVVSQVPSQNYIVYQESQVETAEWSTKYADGKIMSDVKTISLLTGLGKTSVRPFPDAKLVSRQPSKSLQLLYHSPQELPRQVSRKYNITYLIFTDDMVSETYAAHNFYLKPLGRDRVRAAGTTADIIYDNGKDVTTRY